MSDIFRVWLSCGRFRSPSILAVLAVFLWFPVHAQKLEITGQKSLSTDQGKPITLKLTDFSVKGSGDNEYPDGFELNVSNGRDYKVSGTTVTPDEDFTGRLKVEIRIKRIKGGKMVAQTKKTDITIEVRAAAAPQNVPPQIIGQTALRTSVNRPITVSLSNLTVVDPDNDYPAGFTLKLNGGSNYTLSGATVTPATDYTGELRVKTIVNDGRDDSAPFELRITVVADNSDGNDGADGNDDSVAEPGQAAPEITVFSADPLNYPIGYRNFQIAREIGIEDKDSEELFYAEVYFDPALYLAGKDELLVNEHPVVQSVFDAKKGLLLLFGRASVDEYQALMRSVRYQFVSDTLPGQNTKKVHFRLNDGIFMSEVKTKTIRLIESVVLDIPAVFTPNDDQSNDTWLIRPSRNPDNLAVMVRVFDRRGGVVYESTDLTTYWDGRFQGNTVPAGVYFYVIDVQAGANSVNYKGTVMLLR